MIVKSLVETIGNTPLLHLGTSSTGADTYLKLEMFNPTGSMKDRMAQSMIDTLELQLRDQIKAPKIVESSSGNTASALSMLCAARGWEFTAIMDGHASKDKVRSVLALGGAVEFVGDGTGELSTAIRDDTARRLAETGENTFWTAQHDNPANSAGYASLADELVKDLGKDIYAFVSAIGTGGSLCGTAQKLKAINPGIFVVGVEPEGSVIFGGPSHDYHQSGTGTPHGADVGLVIDYDVIDEGRKVSDRNAFVTCHFLARKFGLLVGGSTGGAVFEALKVAEVAPSGSKIVSIACDNGSKYLDTIFSNEWLSERHLACDA
jgi:cystathionine beta-synthase|tara:strand:+ start:5363 stop:6322 length:960 start_codon:yes stop_codon:yes gene_type:complete